MHEAWTYDFEAGKSSTRAIGMGPANLARCHFRTQKSLDFQGPTLTMALVMDIARLKIISSRSIKTTGTLIVINSFCFSFFAFVQFLL